MDTSFTERVRLPKVDAAEAAEYFFQNSGRARMTTYQK